MSADGAAGPADPTVTVLERPPALAPMFARAVARRKRGGEVLPGAVFALRERPSDQVALAGYQRLCGFDVSSVVPSTFVHVRTFPLGIALMSATSFPFPLLGLVHVHNSITQHRPVDAGEPLALSARATNLSDHSAGRQFDIVAEARVGDEVVWRGVSTYLHRGPTTGARAVPRPAAEAPTAPAATWRLARDVGRSYAAVSGDRNPIHLSALSAKAFGFPRAIAHGMYLAARSLAVVHPRLAAGYVYDVAFKTPALLPSTVAFDASHANGGWTLTLADARSGKPHLAATITPLR